MPAIAPGVTAEDTIRGFCLPDADGGERWLTLRLLTAEAADWAEAGHEIGWAQVPLDDTAPDAAPGSPGAAPHQGWTGDVALDDRGYLLHPRSRRRWPSPLARPDGQRPDRRDGARWAGWGLPPLTRRLDGSSGPPTRSPSARPGRRPPASRSPTPSGSRLPATAGSGRGDGRGADRGRRPRAGRNRARARGRSRGVRVVRRPARRPDRARAGGSGGGGRPSPTSSSPTSGRRRTAATPTRWFRVAGPDGGSASTSTGPARSPPLLDGRRPRHRRTTSSSGLVRRRSSTSTPPTGAWGPRAVGPTRSRRTSWVAAPTRWPGPWHRGGGG
jgi:hypothetical protein